MQSATGLDSKLSCDNSVVAVVALSHTRPYANALGCDRNPEAFEESECESGRKHFLWLCNSSLVVKRSGIRASRIRLACDARNACQRLLEAGVCGRVGVGAREWRGHPLCACVRENRAGVYAFVWMAGKCVS